MGKFKHGKSRSPIHNKWWSMLQRCSNPKIHNYYRYGGRGIKVCKRWHTFENFYADMGDCPNNYTLERIDNNGDYSPENLPPSSAKKEYNRRTRFITFQDKTQSLKQWVDEFNSIRSESISYNVVKGRLNNGWDFMDAITRKKLDPRL